MEFQKALMASGASDKAAGTYSTDLRLEVIVAALEWMFPGSRDIIDKIAAVLPLSKLLQAIRTAISDWTIGKDFLAILKDVVSEWLTVEEDANGIRFKAKPE